MPPIKSGDAPKPAPKVALKPAPKPQPQSQSAVPRPAARVAPKKKPKPADDANFQQSLTTHLAGFGFLSGVMEAVEHVDSITTLNVAPGQGKAVAITPDAAINPSRRFVPR